MNPVHVDRPNGRPSDAWPSVRHATRAHPAALDERSMWIAEILVAGTALVAAMLLSLVR
jgi:hypothetical protein